MFTRITLALVIAASLTACGGGDEFEMANEAADIETMSYEPPARGPEWLNPPASEGAAESV